MDARSRSRVGLAALLVLCLSGGFLVWQHPRDSSATAEGEKLESAWGESPSPGLAGAPSREAASDRTVPRGSPEAAALASTEDVADGSCWGGSDVDDPALPKERVPLAVTLVDPGGKPIPGAAVQAVWGEWRTKTYRADAEGRVTMSVPRGARSLEVVGLPRGETRRFLLVHFHGLSGVESETRVAVRVGSEISGTLVSPDGAPIEDAKIRSVPQAYGFGPTTTDQHGRFQLNVLDGTEVEVTFDGWVVRQHEGSTKCVFYNSRARAFSVRAGTADLRLTAETVTYEESLPLRILDVSGHPAEGAKVTFRAGGGMDAHSVFADASGRVVVPSQAAWPTDVNVRVADGPGQRFDGLVPGRGEVELRMSPRTELHGRVLDAKGKPVAGAWCAVLSGHEYLACFATDADGRFSTMLPVAPGTRLQLSARFPMEEPTSRGVLSDVAAGASEPTIVLDEVGPLESEARRANKVKITAVAGVGIIRR